MSKLEESQAILKQFEMPLNQQNVASGYTLLALANLNENDSWNKAQRIPVGVREIIRFAQNSYDQKPFDREFIRRRVLQQFEQAHLIQRNPDDPTRPTNSGKFCYVLTPDAHSVLASFGTSRFRTRMKEFLKKHEALSRIYRAERGKVEVEVTMPDGAVAYLSPGRHNELQAAVLRDFFPRFIPDAKLLYLGDTAKKDWHVDQEELERIGLPFSIHDKYPDLVFWLETKQWLILIEAVTSHGPFSPKRRGELEHLLQKSHAHRVYVTAFPSLTEFKKHLHEIAWETEVWLAEVPDHMIHYNGPKFLAPLNAATKEKD